jgi:hypothetical protein
MKSLVWYEMEFWNTRFERHDWRSEINKEPLMDGGLPQEPEFY